MFISIVNYWLIITRLASASRSIYGVPSTVTPTKSSFPPENLLGVGYNSLTASSDSSNCFYRTTMIDNKDFTS